MPKAAKKAKAALSSVKIPKPDFSQSNGTSPVTPITPKTPADEGIEFFESASKGDQPIRVYELRLDPDGGPNKDRAVSTILLTARAYAYLLFFPHLPVLLSLYVWFCA